MTLRDQILQQALTLPFEDREYLAEQLGDSLQAGRFATEEIGKSWSQEIDQRIAAFDRSESTTIELDTAVQKMRDAVAAYQNHRAAQ
ncbi:addiction module protein [Planctopirus hydrillae]|nr:addiction module protein [Planctopirus hydrillae]